MTTEHCDTDILIIGAGLAGLCAATRLLERGRDVTVVDKGRGVGGRMATRRIGAATCDHGAQFMTARDPQFMKAVSEWSAQGIVEEWHRSSISGGSGHPRWRGNPSMTAVPKCLARSVDVRLGCRILGLERRSSTWRAKLKDGATMTAASVVLTAPLPQSLELLDAETADLPRHTLEQLEAIQYERCLAVMAVLAGPSRVPPPGGFSPQEDSIAWMADNHMKGISAVPAVTIHATGEYSLNHWDDDRQHAAGDLLNAAAPWLDSEVTECQIHGWRFSKPIQVAAERCVTIPSHGLVFAGDAFGGPRVEGAALSGWAAAEALTG